MPIRRTIRHPHRRPAWHNLPAPERFQGDLLPPLGQDSLRRPVGARAQHQGSAQGLSQRRRRRALHRRHGAAQRRLELSPARDARLLRPSLPQGPRPRHRRQVRLHRSSRRASVPSQHEYIWMDGHHFDDDSHQRRALNAEHATPNTWRTVEADAGHAPARRRLDQRPLRLAQHRPQVHQGPALPPLPSQALHPRPDRRRHPPAQGAARPHAHHQGVRGLHRRHRLHQPPAPRRRPAACSSRSRSTGAR